MELKSYRVRNFRSVEDSGWIELDRVTAFIGVNESGKTNLLMPLWKFNPAREGEIEPTSDYPKRSFGEIRSKPEEYVFIEAEFSVPPEVAQALSEKTGAPADQLKRAIVSRNFARKYSVKFPDVPIVTAVPASSVVATLQATADDLRGMTALAKEGGLKDSMLAAIDSARTVAGGETVDLAGLNRISETLLTAQASEPAPMSTISPRFAQAINWVKAEARSLSRPRPEDIAGVTEIVVSALPKFVYYSNYGNLDSEIYLPHVVQNLERTDLGPKESAKARTLRVLFSFVRLEPKEILDLGKDFRASDGRAPTNTEIDAIAEKKRERSILLQSAGTELTTKFRDWWKQGDYRFRFEADGDHFRIWVADDRRPEDIELESRSTGLQWFLSFFLVFLVESAAAHKGAVLLLDEPGISLHPLAQRDLSAFFQSLAHTNQIVYTTHSPFLVDGDHLDRARKVYVAQDGTTKASADLRAAQGKGEQAGAAYAVYSALNLTVGESLLLGCQPVIVEGASDQHYLSAIKALLIGAGAISPLRELVFPPSGGTKTIRPVASILTGRDEALPVVLLDADPNGQKMAKELATSLYANEPGLVMSVGDYSDVKRAEIEDLFPADLVADEFDRLFRLDEKLCDNLLADEPIVPQMEAWAARHDFALPKGWKVELAKRVKKVSLDRGLGRFEAARVERWTALFRAFLGTTRAT